MTDGEVVFCLEGSRGGRFGEALADICAELSSPPLAAIRLTGGAGRLLVDKPVRSDLKGNGGGGALCISTSSSCTGVLTCLALSISDRDRGAPSPDVCGVISFGKAAPPW